MNCKNCNAQINDGSSFCSMCGQKVELETTQTNIEQKKSYCNYCNNRIPKNSIFCAVCGKKIPENQRVDKTSPVVNDNSLQSNNVDQNNFPQGQQYNQRYYGSQPPFYSAPEFNKSKSTTGSIFAMFLGIIGLIIGLCLYPSGTKARKTFVTSWLTTFLICSVFLIIFSFVLNSYIIPKILEL